MRGCKKKLFAGALSLVMAFSLSVSVLAARDTTMEGWAFFTDGVTYPISSGFSNRTYGDTFVSVSGESGSVAACLFTISSEDGEYEHYSYIN